MLLVVVTLQILMEDDPLNVIIQLVAVPVPQAASDPLADILRLAEEPVNLSDPLADILRLGRPAERLEWHGPRHIEILRNGKEMKRLRKITAKY